MNLAPKIVSEYNTNYEAKLDLSHMNLKRLPKLEPFTYALFCDNNELKTLGELPDFIHKLDCRNNQLTQLPDNLPMYMKILMCSGNPYLHVPEKVALKFDIESTPDYDLIMTNLKKILIAKNKKLY